MSTKPGTMIRLTQSTTTVPGGDAMFWPMALILPLSIKTSADAKSPSTAIEGEHDAACKADRTALLQGRELRIGVLSSGSGGHERREWRGCRETGAEL